jgi:Ca2+-binding EF-hand superfamily protein
MKKRISLLCVLCATLVLTGLQAWAAEETQKRPGARRPSREAAIKKFDKDKDGKLNDEERTAARAARRDREGGAKRHRSGPPKFIIKKFDKDGDGKLNEEEKKAAHAAHKARHDEMRAKLLALFDADKDGKLNEKERQAASKTRMELRWEGLSAEVKERLTRRFDKDKNGELSDKERKAAMTARHNRNERRHKDRCERPGRGRRGGSGEGKQGKGRQGEGRQNKGPQGGGK